MRYLVAESFTLKTQHGDVIIPVGKLLKLTPEQASKLGSKIRPVASADSYLDSPKAWLVNGELRIRGYIPDLASEIIKLTTDNLPEQKRLLPLHVEPYSLSGNRFAHLAEEWKERVGILESGGEMTREQAEIEAARFLRLEAFLPELRGKGDTAPLPPPENRKN